MPRPGQDKFEPRSLELEPSMLTITVGHHNSLYMGHIGHVLKEQGTRYEHIFFLV